MLNGLPRASTLTCTFVLEAASASQHQSLRLLSPFLCSGQSTEIHAHRDVRHATVVLSIIRCSISGSLEK